MHCPKCGGEIPFYDLKPNCKHCGVNIMYYTQEAGLTHDAKVAELEAASARMIIARIKANFIGGKLQIVRLVVTLLAAASLLIPFGGMQFAAPFFHESFSAGLIGLIKAFNSGLLLMIPQLLSSALFSKATLAAMIPAAFLVAVAVVDVVIFCIFLLGFLNVRKTTKAQMIAALVGAILSVAGFAATLGFKLTTAQTPYVSVVLGYGALAAGAVFAVLILINRALLKKGVEPQYRPNDPKRKELLKKVRKGEVDIDTLPLPIYEDEAEREARLKALEEALKAEEEGKEL